LAAVLTVYMLKKVVAALTTAAVATMDLAQTDHRVGAVEEVRAFLAWSVAVPEERAADRC
jgi:hypothetical protein